MNASKRNKLQHRSVPLKSCRVNGTRPIGFESITQERESRLALKNKHYFYDWDLGMIVIACIQVIYVHSKKKKKSQGSKLLVLKASPAALPLSTPSSHSQKQPLLTHLTWFYFFWIICKCCRANRKTSPGRGSNGIRNKRDKAWHDAAGGTGTGKVPSTGQCLCSEGVSAQGSVAM